jgi:hypothetical protein
MSKRLASHYDDEAIAPSDVIDGYLRLLTRIITIAALDLERVDGCDGEFSDEKHRSLCNKMGFKNGREELESFFMSEWFEHISEELNKTPDKARINLGLIKGETSLDF